MLLAVVSTLEPPALCRMALSSNINKWRSRRYILADYRHLTDCHQDTYPQMQTRHNHIAHAKQI